jgi:hypothetical protein
MFRDWSFSEKINLAVGAVFFVIGLYGMASTGGLAGFVIGMLFGIAFGVTGGRVIVNHMIEAFVYGSTGMSDKAEPSPPRLEFLQGLVKQKRYDEAEPMLIEELKDFPKSVRLLFLLAEVYVSDPAKNGMARGLLRGYFELREDIVEEDVDLLMLYADICEDAGKISAARTMLEAELDKAHPKVNLKSIRRRLEALNKG